MQISPEMIERFDLGHPSQAEIEETSDYYRETYGLNINILNPIIKEFFVNTRKDSTSGAYMSMILQLLKRQKALEENPSHPIFDSQEGLYFLDEP